MKAVFLDRDGVINEYPGDLQYVTKWSNFRFLPDVKQALKRLTENGFKIFVISNQAGVSKGVFSQTELDLITSNMLKELLAAGAKVQQVYYCVHRPEDNCSCRKPKTGLIDLAMQGLSNQNRLELQESYFIGDTIRDIETGRSAGLKTILVFSGKEKPENEDSWTVPPDFTARDLAAAVDIIL